MNLYNTLTRGVEPFSPSGEDVKIYVCGITPYDTTHLGHAFTYTIADILIRYLDAQGLRTNYVQNVTDIDDDILKKAAKIGEDWRKLGDRWTTHFIQDMKTLNVRPPDHFPRATDVIPQIIAIVQSLLESGVAYKRNGNVYYDIHAWEPYGKLSRLTKDEMLPIANERGNNPKDPHKNHPLDFVLWQAQGAGEPAWESPWGLGRPGWHIECSTMATNILGDNIDIHLGGSDLLFPHHECEIAQVEPLTGSPPYVRHWMHVAMVYHGEEKMSKSLGNLIMVRDLLETYSPDTLRLYLASYHYRQEWSHDVGKLDQSAQLADRLKSALNASGGSLQPLDHKVILDTFTEALDDDLNTPQALTALERLATQILQASSEGRNVSEAQTALRKWGSVFGLRFDAHQADQQTMTGWDQHLQRFSNQRITTA